MSTPYERILQSRPRSSLDPKPPPSSSSASVRDISSGSMTPTSAQANAKKLTAVKRAKPLAPFFVRPRYRFDLPEPPMDMKMLLGQLSTGAFCEPFVSDLEKEFRPVAIPAEPTHALRANLNIPAMPRPVNNHSNSRLHPSRPDSPTSSSSFKLTINDDALLQSVVNARMATSKLSSFENTSLRSGASNMLSSSAVSTLTGVSGSVMGMGLGMGMGMGMGMGVANAAHMQASSVSNAPWMRRMSYDEYAGSNTATQRAIDKSKLKPKPLISKSDRDAAQKAAAREKRKNQLMATFALVKQPPTHPDMRKSNVKPVSVMPVFPDFKALGSNFILMAFDKDEHLTIEERLKDEPAAGEESVRSLASVTVAQNEDEQHQNKMDRRKQKQQNRKFIACYTPTDSTLEKRARKKRENASDNGDDDDEEEEENQETEDETKEAKKKKKRARKIHFVPDETYEWFGEYVIREGHFEECTKLSGPGNRSCFAVKQQESKDRSERVACFVRIGTSWRLSRKPVDEETGRLGKEGLQLNRTLDELTDVSDERKLRLISGHHVAEERPKRKREGDLVEMLEED